MLLGIPHFQTPDTKDTNQLQEDGLSRAPARGTHQSTMAHELLGEIPRGCCSFPQGNAKKVRIFGKTSHFIVSLNIYMMMMMMMMMMIIIIIIILLYITMTIIIILYYIICIILYIFGYVYYIKYMI